MIYESIYYSYKSKYNYYFMYKLYKLELKLLKYIILLL